MKIICTEKEKELLVAVLSWRVYCMFDHKYCEDMNCIECVESKINWEITE